MEKPKKTLKNLLGAGTRNRRIDLSSISKERNKIRIGEDEGEG